MALLSFSSLKHIFRARQNFDIRKAVRKMSESTTPTPKVYVVGLLAANKDRRLAADFTAFRDLFHDARDVTWLAPTAADWEVSDWNDPYAQQPCPAPVDTVSLDDLKTFWLLSILDATRKAQENDIIVLVLCGNADEDNGQVIMGAPGEAQHLLTRGQVEISLRRGSVPRGRVFLLSDAGYSRRWRSEAWTLFAVADSAATSTSSSGEMRGSVYSILAERAAQANMHDDTTRARPNLPIEPASEQLIRPCTAEFLQRLQVFEPSEPIDSGEVTAVKPRAGYRPLSPEEKTLLRDLATAHNRVIHANVAPDVAINAMARDVAKGVQLPDNDERRLLECLRYRDRDSRRASIIAKQLGWASRIPVERWIWGNGLESMMLAEVHGAAIATEFFLGPHVGARWWDPNTVG
ncbi:hypothetical protein B0H12DRAFT_1240142 [Mycena haematopus]|nr:hypothetical protein B0H12DRAFT_1240142 [Mycena haematopus]